MATRRRFWFLRRADVAAEVDEELQLHLDLRIAELREAGVSADEARATALRQFGDLEATRRYCHQQDVARENVMQRTLWFADLVQDVKIAVRSLRRAPLLTLTIVVSVGLGLGATAAIVGAVNAAMLRPLPYADPERLVRIYTAVGQDKFPFSVADYLALSTQQTHFARTASYTTRAVSYAGATEAELLEARLVSWEFFGVLGVRPAIGRDFGESDGRPGAPPVAIASHAFWQRRLGGRRDAIGGPLRLDGADYTLVGVMPPARGPLERGAEVFLVQQFRAPVRKGPFFLSVIARLTRDAQPAAAASELHAINRALFPVWQASYQDESATWGLENLRTHLLEDLAPLAGLALAAVGLVWLLACTNASNLLVGRASRRQGDLAVRTALGASRGRILRHLLAESAVLATGAGVLGAVVAWVGLRAIAANAGDYVPRVEEIAFDPVVAGIVCVLVGTSAVLFGLPPALQATRPPSRQATQASRTVTSGRSVRRLRLVLVAAQFAIATPLLIGATLLIASLHHLQDVELGFDPSRILTASIRLPLTQYAAADRRRVFWDELRLRLEAIPGVGAVAFADGLAPSNVSTLNNFDLERRPTAAGQPQPLAPWLAVTPEYARTLGLTLLEGRFLDESDVRAEDELAVVVDQAWARRHFPERSAVGERLRGGGCTTCPWTTVVGVVSTVKYAGLDRPEEGTVYTALAGRTSRYVVMRTAGDPRLLAAPLARVLHELEPAAPLTDVATGAALVDAALEQPQTLSWLVAGFAAVAVFLSAIGIFGAMGYYVQQHLRDMCIRLALGGSRGDVARLVVVQGVAVAACGIALGLGLAVMTTRFMASLLFGVQALEPLMYALAGSGLLVVAMVSCAVPAWRAMRLQPAAVLRGE